MKSKVDKKYFGKEYVDTFMRCHIIKTSDNIITFDTWHDYDVITAFYLLSLHK